MTCAEVSQRLVDYLYEELSPGDRQTFESHLTGCDVCRREVDSLARTLGMARVALSGPLADAPPPSIRLAAEAVAHAEVAARAVQAAAAEAASVAAEAAPAGADEAVAAAAPSEKAATPSGVAGATGGSAAPGGTPPFVAEPRTRAARPIVPHGASGLWGWLRRPWFIPALATASVLGLFFVARQAVLDEPNRLFKGQAEQESVPVAAPVAAQAKAQESAPLPSEDRAATGKRDDLDRLRTVPHRELSRAVIREPLRFVPTPKGTAGAIGAGGGSVEGNVTGGRVTGGASPGSAFASLGARHAESVARPAAVSRKKPARGGADEDLASTPPAEAAPAARWALPPPAAPAVNQPPADSTAEAAAPARARAPAQSPPLNDEGPTATARAELPSAAPAPASASSKPAPPAEPAPPAAAEADGTPTAVPDRRAEADEAPASFDTLLTRADRQFTEQRWTLAAASYRELLHRFPTHKDVPVWKRRLELSLHNAQP